MKKFLLFLFISFSANLVFSQIKEGHMKYEVKVESVDPKKDAASQMFENSTMEVFFKDQQTRTVMNMGGFMNTITVNDDKTGDILILMSGMMGKKGILTNVKDMKKRDEESAKNNKLEIKLSDETKTILGYTCKKATIISDKKGEMTYWYTTEISYSKKGNSMFQGEMPGIPLEFSMQQGTTTLTWTATLFEKTIDDATELFVMEIPADYETITYEALMRYGF